MPSSTRPAAPTPTATTSGPDTSPSAADQGRERRIHVVGRRRTHGAGELLPLARHAQRDDLRAADVDADGLRNRVAHPMSIFSSRVGSG